MQRERFVRIEQSNFGLKVWKKAIAGGVDTMKRPLTAVYRVKVKRMVWINLTTDSFLYFSGCIPIRTGKMGQVFKLLAPGIVGLSKPDGNGSFRRVIFAFGFDDAEIPEHLLQQLPGPEPLIMAEPAASRPPTARIQAPARAPTSAPVSAA